MIFIVGGMSQGKTAYAKSLESEKRVVFDDLIEMFWRDYCAYKEKHEEIDLRELELYEKMVLNEMILKDSKDIFVGTEIGCGIVPMDKDDRMFRDLNGRLNCYLASEADQVVRMICGVPQIIKKQA